MVINPKANHLFLEIGLNKIENESMQNTVHGNISIDYLLISNQ